MMRECYEQYAQGGISGDYIAAAAGLKMVGMLTKEKSNSELKTLGISRVEKTVSYLDEFYYLDTPVSELAEMSATCVSNLEKVFKSCLGMTPLAYRNKLRMERAKMLLSGGVPIAQACRSVGIADVYYFSKLFKRYCGMSPGAYAKTNKTV
jgi:AraC-like DNA-binding protein